jgi:resuscitation-promoting factor RpfB
MNRVIGLTFASLILALCSGANNEDSSPRVVHKPLPSTPSAATPSVAVVPQVTGLPLNQARKRLHAEGLRVGDVETRPSAQDKGTVLAQGDKKGAEVESGSAVRLVVAAPLPKVPKVVGEQQSVAERQIRHAGFKVKVKKQSTSSAPDGAVLSQLPRGGVSARAGAVVVITVAKKPPAPISNCTSGYSPCLPLASDYDCAGGSGDGPKYVVGPVQVTGSDPYDLDADNDGLGCEEE